MNNQKGNPLLFFNNDKILLNPEKWHKIGKLAQISENLEKLLPFYQNAHNQQNLEN